MVSNFHCPYCEDVFLDITKYGGVLSYECPKCHYVEELDTNFNQVLKEEPSEAI